MFYQLRYSMLAAVMAAALVIQGCAPTMEGQRTQGEGALIGAAVGGIFGAIFGGRKGAVIGTLVGAGAGFAAGSAIAQRKEEYASEEAFYDGQIAQSRQVNTELRQYNTELRRVNRQREAEIAQLIEARRRGTVSRASLRESHSRIVADRRQAEKVLTTVRNEVQIQEEVLAELETKRGTTDVEVRQLRSEVDSMRVYVAELEDAIQGMARTEDSLAPYL